MRNRLLSFALVLVVLSLVLSCSEEEPQAKKTELVGTIWGIQSHSAVNCTDPLDNEDFTCDTGYCQALILNANGTVDIYYPEGSGQATYTQNGNILTVQVDVGVFLEITYVIEGDKMTITYTDDGCDVTEVYMASDDLPLQQTNWLKTFESKVSCTDGGLDCDDCSFDDQSITFASDGSTGTVITNDGSINFDYTDDGSNLAITVTDNTGTNTMNISYTITYGFLTLSYTNEEGCVVTEIYTAVEI